ncbi:hypothetical protein SCUCBS95973_005479 [Sporothrix curviconia]|uniref:PhoD-like phosphatase metallophosphatase domain-containing protein n=1 Tax=Sporothrix curviconia TaxID=1260050 RepID=A0ABP0BY64_9PEZI
MLVQTRIASATSLIIRLASYFFLRWALFPPVPPLVFALLAVNIPSFVLSHRAEPQYEIVKGPEFVVMDTIAEAKDGDAVFQEEDVDITATVTVQQRPHKILRTLLLGFPSPSKLLSLLAVLTNILLALLITDRVYSEHAITGKDLSFVRIGYVSDSSAKFLIREPDQAKMPLTLEIRLRDRQPPFDTPMWEVAGGVRWTDNTTDYTAVLDVPLRHPMQHVYEWRTSNNHSGEFTAAPKAGQAPSLHDGNFTFVATSCMLSRVPYDPRDHPLAIPGTRHLAKVLPTLGAQFMLFLGDFIYVDVPRWWGKSVSDYRQKYRQVYASPDWNPIAQNLSWIHVLDDHEIANDWSEKQTGIYHAAVDPYHHYHTSANPPLARQAGASGLMRGPRAGATYFEFSQGPASFFMLDTRSYRSSNKLPFDSTNKTMLGAEQLADFLAFLRRPEPRGIKWKIVASSVPFTKNWRINTRDTWGGFLVERQIILEAMWDAGLQGTGVVILSGDRHEFGATKFPPPAVNESSPSGTQPRWPASVTVHEFSASPLSQFYSPIPSYFQSGDTDIKLKYIYRGNSKFGAITILPSAEGDSSAIAKNDGSIATGTSRLHYRLFINGEEAWDTTLESPKAITGPKAKPQSFWSKLLG